MGTPAARDSVSNVSRRYAELARNISSVRCRSSIIAVLRVIRWGSEGTDVPHSLAEPLVVGGLLVIVLKIVDQVR
jgi:hypothetical protein